MKSFIIGIAICVLISITCFALKKDRVNSVSSNSSLEDGLVGELYISVFIDPTTTLYADLQSKADRINCSFLKPHMTITSIKIHFKKNSLKWIDDVKLNIFMNETVLLFTHLISNQKFVLEERDHLEQFGRFIAQAYDIDSRVKEAFTLFKSILIGKLFNFFDNIIITTTYNIDNSISFFELFEQSNINSLKMTNHYVVESNDFRMNPHISLCKTNLQQDDRIYNTENKNNNVKLWPTSYIAYGTNGSIYKIMINLSLPEKHLSRIVYLNNFSD